MRAALDAGEPIRVCLALAQRDLLRGGGRQSQAWCASRRSASASTVDRDAPSGIPRCSGSPTPRSAIACAPERALARRRAVTSRPGSQTLRDHGAGVRWEIDLGDTYWLATLFYLGEWREMARLTQLLLRDAIDRADVVAQQGLRGRALQPGLAPARPARRGARAARDIAEAPSAPASTSRTSARPAAANDRALHRRRRRCRAPARGRVAADRAARLPAHAAAARRARRSYARARCRAAGSGRGRARRCAALADELIRRRAGWAAGLGSPACARRRTRGAGAPSAARVELLAAEEQLVAAGMMGFLHVARMRRGRIEGGAVGVARARRPRAISSKTSARSEPRGNGAGICCRGRPDGNRDVPLAPLDPGVRSATHVAPAEEEPACQISLSISRSRTRSTSKISTGRPRARMGLTKQEVESLLYFADIESQTVHYFLEVAKLKVARDPELLTFLTMWNYEEYFHSYAITRLLEECGVGGADRAGRAPPGPRQRAFQGEVRRLRAGR